MVLHRVAQQCCGANERSKWKPRTTRIGSAQWLGSGTLVNRSARARGWCRQGRSRSPELILLLIVFGKNPVLVRARIHREMWRSTHHTERRFSSRRRLIDFKQLFAAALQHWRDGRPHLRRACVPPKGFDGSPLRPLMFQFRHLLSTVQLREANVGTVRYTRALDVPTPGFPAYDRHHE